MYNPLPPPLSPLLPPVTPPATSSATPSATPPIAPPAYSIEGLMGNRPQTSLLDRIHRDADRERDQEEERAAKKRKIEDQVRRTREQADRYAEEAKRKALEPPPQPPPRHPDGSFNIEWKPNERREKVMYVEDCESGVIPERTSELCLWDMQPFSGTPFPIPVQFDARHRKILVRGYTCSVSCALAFVNSNTSTTDRTLDIHRHIVQLAKDYFGATFSKKLIMPAPPREKLSKLYSQYLASGAPDPMLKAVEEFRNGTEELIYHMHPAPPFIRVTTRIDEEIVRKEQEERHRHRLELMQQTPKPIACTARGMREQRNYVLSARTGGNQPKRGTIDALLDIKYVEQNDDSDENGDYESGQEEA